MNRPVRYGALPTSLAVAAVLSAAGLARGQARGADEGPVIVGERRQGWRAFELKRFGADAEVYGRSRTDKQDIQGQPGITDREALLRETLDLNFEAYIGHQYLIDLTGTVGLRYEERWIDNESLGQGKDREGQFDNLFDVHALTFGNSTVPTDFYARREEVQQDRAFASSLTTTTTEYGALATIQSQKAPTTLRLYTLETDQNDDFGTLSYNQTQDSFAGNSNILLAENNQLEVNYTFDRVNQSQSDGFGDDYDRNDFSLTDIQTFGGEKRHQLRSYLRYYGQTGIADTQQLRWDEQLYLHHSERLDTQYNFSAQQQDIQGVEQWLVRGDGSVRHKLFESLVSTARLGGQTLNFDDFSSDEWFVSGNLDYTKQVPFGLLEASAGLGYSTQDNSERGTAFDVLDEPHVYVDPFPITIGRRQIVPGSITVSAPGGFPVYAEGVDYTTQYFPDRAEIQPIVGGGISNGQAVWVDYTVGPEPSSQIDTLVTTTALRYTVQEGVLTGVSVYGHYRTRDPSVSTSDPSLFVLEELTDILYGVEYRRWGLLLRAEQQNYDSSVNPYDLTRFQVGYDQRFGRSTAVTIDYTHEDIQYEMPANTLILDRFTAYWAQRVTEELDFGVRLAYRMEQNELDGDSQGLDEALEFHWKRGRTTVFGNIRNDDLDTDTSNTSTLEAELGIRRSF